MGNETIKAEGIVEEALPGLMFRVSLFHSKGGEAPEKRVILAHLAGKMKLHRIKIVSGDKVLVEVTRVEDERGRIIRRY